MRNTHLRRERFERNAKSADTLAPLRFGVVPIWRHGELLGTISAVWLATLSELTKLDAPSDYLSLCYLDGPEHNHNLVVRRSVHSLRHHRGNDEATTSKLPVCGAARQNVKAVKTGSTLIYDSFVGWATY